MTKVRVYFAAEMLEWFYSRLLSRAARLCVKTCSYIYNLPVFRMRVACAVKQDRIDAARMDQSETALKAGDFAPHSYKHKGHAAI